MKRLQRALALALVLLAMGTAVVYAEPHEHSDCGDYTEAPIGVFVDKACLPTAPWWPISTNWETSLEGEAINDSISSVFVQEGWSVLVAESPDGSGLTACLTETKWEMDGDSYPASETKMGDSISHFRVFDNATCAGNELPAEEEPTYCDDLSFAGVGLFDLAACQLPGAAITSTITGTVELGLMSGQASSLYVSEGWSLLVSDGTQEVCIFETKWDLLGDKWEDGTSQDGTISLVVVFNDSNCGYDELPAPDPTFCDSLNYVGVVLFDKVACEQPGGYLVVSHPGIVNMMQYAGNTSSVYVSKGWSAKVSDGTHVACFGETKWDLMSDMWPETEIFIGDSITEVIVYNDPDCGKQDPVEEVKTYCDSLSFVGVGLFDLISCEQPGAAITTTITGTLQLGDMSGLASSAYIADGWSLLASNGKEDYCLIGSKWKLADDKWPSGQVQDNSIISATVFANATCQADLPPVAEKQHTYMPAAYAPMASTYCDSLSFNGVGLYAAKSCQMPGQEATIDSEGELTFDFTPMSVYVASGFSVSVYGVGDQITCLQETKWNLFEDTWPGTDQRMSNIRGAVAYANTNCSANN